MAARAIITMEDGGRIVLELDPCQAPLTIANFKALADQHFYDGLIFHRVIRGFMIQGGCPQGTGTGGPGYQIKGEFRTNGVNNQIRHDRGVISMARATDPDSAGSQFFIMHQSAPHLDGQYAAFGKVSEGMDVVDRIVAAKTGRQDRPLEEQKIHSVVVEETDSKDGDTAK
jgi:peptidyl-prolyl cis-trans isomerase B (cyclophilin B)